MKSWSKLLLALLPAWCVAAQTAAADDAASTLSSEADEEYAAIEAAIAEQEAKALRIGGSVSIDAVRTLSTPHAMGFGASIAFTGKLAHPNAIGQIGISGWPSDLYRGPADGEGPLQPWETFLAVTLYPFTLGPVDLGLYVLAAAQSFDDDVAARGVVGISTQLSFDRIWALRYQLGCTSETNLVNAGVVSSLAVDLVVPYI